LCRRHSIEANDAFVAELERIRDAAQEVIEDVWRDQMKSR
jgi:hypothetical protein